MKETFNFKEFTGKRFRGPNSGISFVSLYSDGFRFSGSFMSKYGLLDHKSVVIYYDQKKKVVGFKFHKGHGTRKKGMLSLKGNYRGKYVRARSAFIELGIDKKTCKGRYSPTQMKKAPKMFLINLTERQTGVIIT